MDTPAARTTMPKNTNIAPSGRAYFFMPLSPDVLGELEVETENSWTRTDIRCSQQITQRRWKKMTGREAHLHPLSRWPDSSLHMPEKFVQTQDGRMPQCLNSSGKTICHNYDNF